jgi:dipeptidyl aminopeptidase/acylaminoacyl peptidase
MRHPLRLATASVVLIALAACTGSAEPQARAPRSPAPATTPSPSAPSSAVPDEIERAHPVSIPALFDQEFDGRRFRVGGEIGRNEAYVRRLVSYESGDLTITGLMSVPHGNGPFPVIVLNHGYIDPDVYTTGRGFERSHDFLSRRGFATVHIDYRNHAGSDDDPKNDLRLRLGYTEDAINVVLAIRRSGPRYLDRERIGMLGRSMGGGVSFNVAVVRPDLVDAMVVFSSVSSDTVDNFNKWIRRRPALARGIIDAYGSPADAPAFWRNVSPRTFFGRIDVPLLVHHGTADSTTPIRWANATIAALRRHGKDVTFLRYRGEEHAFGASAYARAMERTVAFFERNLSADR